ncbi:uncharacterized protein LOC107611391 [Arachis ipaensis]|uniref:uncharacterized protein LOC107611391 n=1 Tax=Arachis ipaensis TaxID=130454 RepID=UPI0007AF1660|nr:uncharacterized protein LOC107611391 [Arachis ipaensis]XP_025670422.1 uncharacterized protein LOC112770245 [Arachis hypogaea]
MVLAKRDGLTLKDPKGFGYLKSLKNFLQFCLASKRKDNMWYLDNGCSRHVTGKFTFFIKLDKYDGDFVTFGDNGKGKIVARVQNAGDNLVLSPDEAGDSRTGNNVLCEDFGKLITSDFDMSMMGELTVFLGLQIKQTPSGIFVHQGKYAKELVKKFGLENSKPMSTPMHLNTKLDKDEKGKDVDETRSQGDETGKMMNSSIRLEQGPEIF